MCSAANNIFAQRWQISQLLVLPTLFIVVNNIKQYCFVEAESGVTMLFNVIDKFEQCGQHNIVQFCSQQHCSILTIFCHVVTSLKFQYLWLNFYEIIFCMLTSLFLFSLINTRKRQSILFGN